MGLLRLLPMLLLLLLLLLLELQLVVTLVVGRVLCGHPAIAQRVCASALQICFHCELTEFGIRGN